MAMVCKPSALCYLAHDVAGNESSLVRLCRLASECHFPYTPFNYIMN